MIETFAFITHTSPKVIYTRPISNYQNTYISSEKNEIEKLINEIKKISQYQIENYDFEKLGDEMVALGIKFKNFPKNQNKTAYAVELMDKLDDKLPENIDIWVV